MEEVKKTGNPVIITQRGRPAALVVNYEEYEGLLHTLDEMSYPDWHQRLEEAERDSKRSKGIPLHEMKNEILKKRAKSRGRH